MAAEFAQSYVFVSHASVDKRQRVRPVVDVLLREGLRVWIDRPGIGNSHFGYTDREIEQHAIRSIRAGEDYQKAILHAVAQSAAVLFCLSRAFDRDRPVLIHELVAAISQDKLVGCIVDDLPYDAIPSDGLISDKIHYERVNPSRLAEAVAELHARDQASGRITAPDDLPEPLRNEWEVARKLKRDVIERFRRDPDLPLPEPTDAEWAAAEVRLAAFPVTPVVRWPAIPRDLDTVLAERFAEPHRATRFLAHAMSLRARVNPEGGTEEQILVRPGELPPARNTPPDEYWSSVVTTAGCKSPRTLAALMLAPHAPPFETIAPEREGRLRAFLERLRSGNW